MTLDRTSLRQQIRDALVERILSGTYPPDTRLKELQLAAEFGTSQAPVREALRELETLHYVTSVPRSGTRVRRPPPGEMRDTYRVRAGLELVAARGAAGARILDPTPLHEAVAGIVRAAAERDLEAYARHDDAFHRSLVEYADNPVLLRQWEQLLVPARALVVLRSGAIDLERTAAEHAPILAAVLAGDARLAGTRAFAHANHIADALERALV